MLTGKLYGGANDLRQKQKTAREKPNIHGKHGPPVTDGWTRTVMWDFHAIEKCYQKTE